MSSTVFPATLPGLLMSLDRDVDYDVTTQRTLTRKELRYTYETIPITKYKLGFEILRSDSSLSNRARELQQVLTQIARHYGQLDSFLLTDLADSSVSDHGFGVGDGSTTAFQLQRTLAGDIIDAAGVEYAAQSKPYTNYALNSSFETDSNADGLADNWAAYNGSANVPQVGRIVPGMNGGKAQRISWGTANTDERMGVIGTVPAATWITNQWFTISYFARAQGGIVGQTEKLQWNNQPSTGLTVANPALSGAWQRYVFQVFWNNGATVESSSNFYLGLNGAGSVFGDIDFDLVQVVKGQHGAAEFQPIETPAATSGTRTPAYWPAFADGFEPISDLNGPPTIYEDNTWRGRRQLYPFIRTNLCPFSEQFDQWTAFNVTTTTNSTTAPDGTSTADTINEGTGVGVEHHVRRNTTVAPAQGDLWRYSIFVKANNLPNIRFETSFSADGIKFNMVTGVIDGTVGTVAASGVITDPRWPGWSRIWFVHRTPASPTELGPLLRGTGDSIYTISYTGTSRTFFAWGAMCERVSEVGAPTPYIPTPSSSAVTVTDYTLSSTGLVTLPAALASGAYLSFDGSYYRRVRFVERNLSVEQMVQSMWEAKSISLVSVKP